MGTKVTDIALTPFVGGVDTVREISSIKEGRYSILQNVKHKHPGFSQRKGQVKHHTVADGSLETMSLFQFLKAGISEKHEFRQSVDGKVLEATDLAPLVTTGVYGSSVLGAISNAIPASWGVVSDTLFFSDGVRQHQVYAGQNSLVEGFFVYNDSAALPNVLEIGKDYTLQVNDGDVTTKAILSALVSGGRFFVITPVPTQKINITIVDANGNAVTLSGKYWNGAWASMAGFADGTASAGKTLAVNGSLSWTAPTDELPAFTFGISGFAYYFQTSAALSATVTISDCSFDSSFQNIVNVWGGVFELATEAVIYDSSSTNYYNYGASSVTISNLQTADKIYFSSIDPFCSLYVDVGATPNIPKATITGSSDITFATGTTFDTITTKTNDFLTSKFQAGMSISVTGTANNNWSNKKIQDVTSHIIYLPTGTVTAEASTSAVITYGPVTTTINSLYVWTGSAFTATTGLSDGTSGIIKSGFVTFNRASISPEKSQFNNSPIESYWGYFTVDQPLTNTVNISIEVIPYFSISDFGLGNCNSAWKGRMCYTFNKFGNDVYISALDSPMTLNGKDFDIIPIGDGRFNDVKCMLPFYNELIVWQEEIGILGGTTTLIQGYSPATYGTLKLSDSIGIMNSKCATIVDGVMTAALTGGPIAAVGSQTIRPATEAYWLSRFGVFAYNSTSVYPISEDISNYFDPDKSECIRKGYEDKMWLAYDRNRNVLRLGLVSGSSAVEPNIFPVYDLQDKMWSFDVLGQPLTCLINTEAGSGNVTVLQVGGGASDGFVYQCNTTADDVSTPVDFIVQKEFDGSGHKIQIDKLLLRCKSQSAGNVSVSLYGRGNTLLSTDSFPMIAGGVNTPDSTAGDSYVLRRYTGRQFTDTHFSIKWEHNTAGESCYLLDYGLELKKGDSY